jgi:hypothetical protein
MNAMKIGSGSEARERMDTLYRSIYVYLQNFVALDRQIPAELHSIMGCPYTYESISY